MHLCAFVGSVSTSFKPSFVTVIFCLYVSW